MVVVLHNQWIHPSKKANDYGLKKDAPSHIHQGIEHFGKILTYLELKVESEHSSLLQRYVAGPQKEDAEEEEPTHEDYKDNDETILIIKIGIKI